MCPISTHCSHRRSENGAKFVCGKSLGVHARQGLCLCPFRRKRSTQGWMFREQRKHSSGARVFPPTWKSSLKRKKCQVTQTEENNNQHNNNNKHMLSMCKSSQPDCYWRQGGCLQWDSVPASLSRLREVIAWLFQGCCRLKYHCIRPHCNPKNHNSAWISLMCSITSAHLLITGSSISKAGRGWRTQDEKCGLHVCTSYLGWWNGTSITIGGLQWTVWGFNGGFQRGQEDSESW